MQRETSFRFPKLLMNHTNERSLAFLRQGTEILITRQDDQPWSTLAAVVAGPDDNSFTRAVEAIEDATGLSQDDITLAAAGTQPDDLIETTVDGTAYALHAFLFDINEADFTLPDRPGVETQWITLNDLDDMETVPGLAAALEACMEAERGKRLRTG